MVSRARPRRRFRPTTATPKRVAAARRPPLLRPPRRSRATTASPRPRAISAPTHPEVRADLLQAFIGTKAQYIKTAPVLRELDARGVAYRLIDSGQHAVLSAGLREELGVHAPDQVLGSARDVVSIPGAAAWATSVAARLAQRPERIRDELFAGAGGICIVHGDTPTTFLATVLARRAGLRVAHLEAGLRSHSLLHPFPEELIRLVVMRWADVLFAPDATAVENLDAMKVRGRVVALSSNTTADALRASLSGDMPPPTGPALFTMHRVENLHRRAVVDAFVELVVAATE